MLCKSCKSWGLCPVSFGLALGIVTGITMFLFSIWMLYHGIPAHLIGHIPQLTWAGTFVHGLVGIIEGFVFGFFVALLYDCFSSCCKAKCCHPEGEGCECGCHGEMTKVTRRK